MVGSNLGRDSPIWAVEHLLQFNGTLAGQYKLATLVLCFPLAIMLTTCSLHLNTRVAALKQNIGVHNDNIDLSIDLGTKLSVFIPLCNIESCFT